MSQDILHSTYPTLCQLLAGSGFDADIAAAIDMAQGPNMEEDIRTALEGGLFDLNELMWLVCGTVVPDLSDSAGKELERNLASIVDTLGIEVARASYHDKLIVNDTNTLEDALYEIAATARACLVLDPGTVQLEKPISDTKKDRRHWKNSDVYGKYRGQSVRIEVTVLHERLPPAIHQELDDLVKATEISSGFRITLRSVLVDKGYAERVRALVELLHECHVGSGGRNEEIDGIRFEWRKGAYFCQQATSPFESVCFYAADDFRGAECLRDLIHPVSVRSMTSQHVLEDHPNPKGVITSADLPDAPTQVPVSTKIHQTLAGKLQQCEEGIVNIVAFGNPSPMYDRDVINAVRGSEAGIVPFWTDRRGIRHSRKGVLRHDLKASFVPAQNLANDDDRREFIEPFRRMSAIWHIRLGTYAKSVVISNPNAFLAAPKELIAALSESTPTNDQGDRDLPSPEPKAQQPDNSEQEEDIVWAEVAENYVYVCGTLSEARSVLAKLEQGGLSLDVLRSKVDHSWSAGSRLDQHAKNDSPTNEEMAMTFVVDCGGYEQAKACLEAYVEERQFGEQ